MVDYCLGSIDCLALEQFHLTLFRGHKRFENICGRVHPSRWPPDSQAQTNEVWGAQGFLNISQAVVASVAAALLDFERPQWQVKLVVDDDDSLWRHFEILRERGDGSTGSVHVTGGHGENDGARGYPARKTPRLLFRECHSRELGPTPDGFFANVVARSPILVPRVSQSDNEPTRLTSRGGGFATSKEQRLLL